MKPRGSNRALCAQFISACDYFMHWLVSKELTRFSNSSHNISQRRHFIDGLSRTAVAPSLTSQSGVIEKNILRNSAAMSQGGLALMNQYVLKGAWLKWLDPGLEKKLDDEWQPTQQTCHLIRFLLLDGLVVECFKEHVQHQDVVSEKREAKQGISPNKSHVRRLLGKQQKNSAGNSSSVWEENTVVACPDRFQLFKTFI